MAAGHCRRGMDAMRRPSGERIKMFGGALGGWSCDKVARVRDPLIYCDNELFSIVCCLVWRRGFSRAGRLGSLSMGHGLLFTRLKCPTVTDDVDTVRYR